MLATVEISLWLLAFETLLQLFLLVAFVAIMISVFSSIPIFSYSVNLNIHFNIIFGI